MPRRGKWKGRSHSCQSEDTGAHGMGWRLSLPPCSLQSVSAAFRWKTWIHGSGMWEYVPIDEPLLPWNQDATYLLSGCIFLQQDLEAGALPCFWLWLGQQKSSTNLWGSIYIWFPFQSTASHMCLCLSVRLMLSIHASPTHSSLSSVFSVPQIHLSTFFCFSINPAWLKNIDSRQVSF